MAVPASASVESASKPGDHRVPVADFLRQRSRVVLPLMATVSRLAVSGVGFLPIVGINAGTVLAFIIKGDFQAG